mmetsp:Transcript_43107/g.58870  ORF Transcript_43107/g.58870 Transcript_43107/m.58870 type:complete len:140 (-) Transcript_43107:383-802(-)
MFSSRERLALLGFVDKMSSAMASCERLVQHPVPLNYARHTSRLLTIWCLTLPLALVHELRLLTAPVVATITWALFGIEEIGLRIEEPFTYPLKLEVLTGTIFGDVHETMFLSQWWDQSRKIHDSKQRRLAENSLKLSEL